MRYQSQKSIQSFSSSSGNLSVLSFSSIPFGVKRIYWIDSVPTGQTRGGHAHKKLCQFFVMLTGTGKIELRSPNSREIFNLSNDGEILIVNPGLWRELKEFSSDAVLLVGASEDYDTEDYIYSWDEYEAWSKEYRK